MFAAAPIINAMIPILLNFNVIILRSANTVSCQALKKSNYNKCSDSNTSSVTIINAPIPVQLNFSVIGITLTFYALIQQL